MKQDEMERLTRGIEIKAEKIRLLHDAGASRSEIAAFMGIKYQHVHNVLKRSNRLVSAEDESVVISNAVFPVKVGKGGGIALPPAYLKAQGISEGDTLICREEGGNIIIMSRSAAVETLMEMARQRMPSQVLLLDALISAPERGD